MRILIATTQMPFVQGGSEIMAAELRRELRAAGHEAEIVAIPFQGWPPERVLDAMLATRLLDLTQSAQTPVDLMIGIKFPAYLAEHPNKVLWLVHQHRAAYNLWENEHCDLAKDPAGELLRETIRRADLNVIPQARAVFTISKTVSRRLREHLQIDSKPLYHPPMNAEKFFCAEAKDYVFFPSRLAGYKRQTLVIEALAHTREPVRVRFAGAADSPDFQTHLRAMCEQHGVSSRIEWLGAIDDENKRQQYAHALGVVFPPLDEDYGYVTLEAMLSSKPVITCCDSSGPLEFVSDRENGFVVEPSPQSLAAALDELWRNRERSRAMGIAGRSRYDGLGISWANVIAALCDQK